jgi:cytochrome c oxidase cbb3-type subunit III
MTPPRDELLDHEADGIREFDNDLPRWWLYGFYATIVFSAVYMVNFHVLPTPLVGHKGVEAEFRAEMAAANRGRPAAGSAPALVVAALTDGASLASGRATFASQTSLCQSCHRPDLGGLVGPNLTDDLWLHGCTPADVMRSITTGYPQRGMLPYGGGPKLSDVEVLQLASYVLSQHGSRPPNPKAADPSREKTCG